MNTITTLLHQLRAQFIKEITHKSNQLDPVEEMFISIFDEHSHSEEAFTSAILFIVDLLQNDTKAQGLGQIALDFYFRNKKDLEIKAQIHPELNFSDWVSIEPEKKENIVSSLVSHNIETSVSFLPSKWQTFVEQLITFSNCPISYEPMDQAITLPCGHSLDLNSIKALSPQGKQPCCYSCRTEVSGYRDNYLIRAAVEKIKQISKINIPGEELILTSEQKFLLQDLQAILRCPNTLIPLSYAVFSPSGIYINNKTPSASLTPDYTLRQLADLAHSLNFNM